MCWAAAWGREEAAEKPSLCLLHCFHFQCLLQKWRLPLLFLWRGSEMLEENKGSREQVQSSLLLQT